MSFLLANLFAPTAAPGAAGGVVGAAGQGNTGAFAEALKAFRASAPEGTGAAGAVISGPAPGVQVQGALQAAPGTGQPKTTAQTLAALSSQLNIDPAILQRVQAGTATPEDIETLKAALVETGVVKPAEKDAASTDETNAAAAAAAAGIETTTPVASAQTQTPPPQTDPEFAAAPEDNVEMALRIADEKRPYVPPRPDLTPTAADPETPSAQLSEGRASTSAAPAAATTDTADGAGAAKDVLAAALPRATAAAATSAAAGTVKSDTPAPPTVPPAAAQAPVPQAAQAIASTPHVTSIQAETVTPAATAETPSAPGTVQAKSEAAVATPAPVETPEIKIAANSTEADAANAALSALTKDKTETKPGAAQPQKADAAQQTATPADGEAAGTAETPEIPAAKPVNAGDEAAKKDVKPETPAPEKPAAAEKPAAPEPRAPQAQAQAPVTDKPIQMDTALRSVQQMQSLPAAAIPQIASEMAARARQGATRFEIRLDPPELGRVDVRIEVDSDGRVHSRLMVEKSETLDLLKADQRALERALHDAGFKSEQNSLSFSLRDDRGGQAKYDDQRFQREMNVPTAAAEEEPARLAAELAYRAPMRGAGGIDVRV